ncbi:MAG: hypothetical protein MHM6MM_005674 [Cercozoa sp. M6MM]
MRSLQTWQGARASDVALDVIIDDGGHQNYQIKNSLMGLGMQLPWRLYFVEDFGESHVSDYYDATESHSKRYSGTAYDFFADSPWWLANGRVAGIECVPNHCVIASAKSALCSTKLWLGHCDPDASQCVPQIKVLNEADKTIFRHPAPSADINLGTACFLSDPEGCETSDLDCASTCTADVATPVSTALDRESARLARRRWHLCRLGECTQVGDASVPVLRRVSIAPAMRGVRRRITRTKPSHHKCRRVG